MGIEAATYVGDLVASNPLVDDPKSEGDDHLRLIKNVLKSTFPNMAGAFGRVTAKAINSSPAANDRCGVWNCTAAISLTPVAAATLTNGWYLWIIANGGDVTVDPNAAETVNGAATAVVRNGRVGLLICNGSAFFLLSVALAGTGSTEDGDRTFSGAVTIQGALTSLGIDDNATVEVMQLADTAINLGIAGAAYTIRRNVSDQQLVVNGGNATSGARLVLFGESHATGAFDFQLQANGVGKVIWDDSAATLTLGSAADLINALGGQIKFPSTQSASSDANTLDDYDEFTWTPVLTFATPGNLAVVYTNQDGRGTKIGNRAFTNFHILTSTFTHTTASGTCQITGNPNAAVSVASITAVFPGTLRWQGITKASYTDIVPAVSDAGTVITFSASGSGVSLTSIAAADMPTAGTVNLAGHIDLPTET